MNVSDYLQILIFLKALWKKPLKNRAPGGSIRIRGNTVYLNWYNFLGKLFGFGFGLYNLFDCLGHLSISILCVLAGIEVFKGGKETDQKHSHNNGIKLILLAFDKEINR